MDKIKYNSIEFTQIKDFPNYYVSECGNVLSINFHRTKKKGILKLSKHKLGYLHINLVGKTKKVHRLVAMTFIPNPKNKPEVNHINSIRDDNRVENLEWVTPSENMQHAYDVGLKVGLKGKLNPLSKKVNQIHIPTGKIIKVWDSMGDVGRHYGSHINCISLCCNGKIKTANGWRWEYA